MFHYLVYLFYVPVFYLLYNHMKFGGGEYEKEKPHVHEVRVAQMRGVY